MSLITNTFMLPDTLFILKHLFRLFLRQFSNDVLEAKTFIEGKIENNIVQYKEFGVVDSLDHDEPPSDFSETAETEVSNLPVKEDVYLQQSKRSIFFKKCQTIFESENNCASKLNQAIDKEANVLYSPQFAQYILNNWCGILPLWTGINLGDQGRHGESLAYSDWSKSFSQRACVKDPPKTQGIIEFHNKSVKHVTQNSKRDRVDKVIGNLFVAKKSKSRQYEIALSRKRHASVSKKKDTMPKKISRENWRKKKQSHGPGFFQKNFIPKASKILEEWEKLSVIPWGGDFLDSTDFVKLINTCTLDNIFQILYTFYALNMHQTRKIFDSDHDLVKKISEVHQLLLTESFFEAKYFWLTSICNLSPTIDSGVLDIYGTDKEISFFHIRHLFRRSYHFQCSSYCCPSNMSDEGSNSDEVSNMTLHVPNTVGDISIEASIREWEEGTSQNALVSCKDRFVGKTSHDEFISELDRGEEIVRCSGWRNFTDSRFVVTPPFLVFELSAQFSEKVKELDMIPKRVTVYGDSYELGGVTSFLKNRSHYVAYIPMKDEFLLYDGIPQENPVLKKYRLNCIRREISLLCFFPVEDDIDISCSNANSLPTSSTTKTSLKANSGNGNESTKAKDNSSPRTETSANSKAFVSDEPSECIDDALLAKALHQIENENSPVSYSKPRGKNYRCRSKGNNLTSIRTVEELQSSSTAQRVLVSDLVPYLHFDRDIQRLPGKRKKYMTQLWCDLIKNGLKYPLSLSISKKTGRAVIFDGNHRLTILRNKNVKWVPLKVSYFFIEDDYNDSFPLVPRTYTEDEWPSSQLRKKLASS